MSQKNQSSSTNNESDHDVSVALPGSSNGINRPVAGPNSQSGSSCLLVAKPQGELTQWEYTRDNRTKLGPVHRRVLIGLIEKGELLDTDMVHRIGEPKWYPVMELVGPVHLVRGCKGDPGDKVPSKKEPPQVSGEESYLGTFTRPGQRGGPVRPKPIEEPSPGTEDSVRALEDAPAAVERKRE